MSVSNTSKHMYGAEIKDLIADCIEVTMDVGAKAHPENSWHAQGLEEHVRRAAIHIVDYQALKDPEDLEHAVTRLAMAYYSLAKGIHSERRQ